MELLHLGYRAVFYRQLNCPHHGVFRVAAEEVPPWTGCPTCQRPCRAIFLAQGLTRTPAPISELIHRPLPAAIKKEFWAKESTVDGRAENYALHLPR
jgi:hypothetical protein